MRVAMGSRGMIKVRSGMSSDRSRAGTKSILVVLVAGASVSGAQVARGSAVEGHFLEGRIEIIDLVAAERSVKRGATVGMKVNERLSSSIAHEPSKGPGSYPSMRRCNCACAEQEVAGQALGGQSDEQDGCENRRLRSRRTSSLLLALSDPEQITPDPV